MKRLLFALLLVPPAACNPYDPNLGDTPFRCGTSQPRCPEGYGPVDVPPPILCECRKGASSKPAADAAPGMFVCNDDSIVTTDPNGNEDIAHATATPIGAGTLMASYQDLAICPGTDVDVFSMNIPQAGVTLEVRVTHDFDQGVLALDILNSGGTVVHMGEQQVNQVRAIYQVPASGTYYARISSPGAVENNYDLQIVVQ